MLRFRDLVDAEKKRQVELWGVQDHSFAVWFIILSEEVGEVAKAIFEGKRPEILTELVQVVAVIESWVESCDWFDITGDKE